jgi:hypothetical protein
MAAAVLALAAVLQALPDGDALMRALAQTRQAQEDRIDAYAYDLREVRESLDDEGRATERHLQRFEVYSVKGRPIRRLVEEDNRALSARRQAEVDAEAAKTAAAIREGRALTESVRPRLLALLERFSFRTLRREEREGRSVLVLEATPRPGAGSDGDGAFARHLEGVVCLDEADGAVIDVRLRNRDPIRKGPARATEVTLHVAWTRVEEGVWLPAVHELVTGGRAFLFKRFRRRLLREYGSYRRFGVEAEAEMRDVP